MNRLVIAVFALLFVSNVAWSQNTNANPSKAKSSNTKASKNAKPAVDCSKTTDAQITESVKARLAATASLKDETINVATSDGVVTLTGTVKSNHKGLASMQSRRVACVKKVDNQLVVEKSATAKPKNANSKKTSNKNS